MISKISYLVLLTLVAAWSAMPVQSGDRSVSAFAYDFSIDGTNITDAEVSAHTWSHRGVFSYAPWEYLELGLGLGAASYEVRPYDDYAFDGKFGFSPMAHIYLSTPVFISDLLRLRGGLKAHSFNSKNQAMRYSGRVFDPQILLVLHTRGIQVELGVQGHWVDGKITTFVNDRSVNFSNANLPRALLNIQYTCPSGWFVLAHGNVSKDPSGWHDGPTETQVGIAIGYMSRPKVRVGATDSLDRYFPSVPELRKKQEALKQELDNR